MSEHESSVAIVLPDIASAEVIAAFLGEHGIKPWRISCHRHPAWNLARGVVLKVSDEDYRRVRFFLDIAAGTNEAELVYLATGVFDGHVPPDSEPEPRNQSRIGFVRGLCALAVLRPGVLVQDLVA